MKDKIFLDTNIIVYAFDRSAQESKSARCAELLIESAENGCGVISTQVCQEFIFVVTRKIQEPISESAAMEIIMSIKGIDIFQVSLLTIRNAIELGNSYKFSFWDRLIISSALASGCKILYSEDMVHGIRIADLKVINPFRSL
ncbi:MAG: PIN domain-containing protein [bacterium]